jgi:hypothetical protein
MVNNKESRMKEMSYYSNVNRQYPTRTAFTKVFVYKAGTVLVDGLSQSVMPKADIDLHYKNGDTVEYVFDEQGFNSMMLAYHSVENALYEEFKRDLFAEFDVTNNPKAEKLFGKCWERGHAHGYSDVYSIFSDFVDVIRDETN